MNESNKNNPFKTPEGYFENFTDGLMDKLNVETSNLPEEDGFAVPEGYFESFHQNIQKKLEPKVVQLHPYRKYYYAAASIAAVVLLVFGLNWNTTTEFTFDELADADLETYFDTNEYGLSSYEIAEVLAIQDLEVSDILETDLDEGNLIDYLDENIDDLNELNLEDYE